MGSKVDIIKEFLDAAWNNPPASVKEANESYLADDFQSLDKDGNAVMNKEAYIATGVGFISTFTDFKWVLKNLRQEGESVIMSGHFEGKHTADLDLSAMGLSVVPASGKMIEWPEAIVEYKFKGDKIASERPYGGASGMDAMLAPLGVKLPAA